MDPGLPMTAPTGDPCEDLAFQVYLDHPLPWRIEQDWTMEVIAADGHIVAKCSSREKAQRVVDWVEAKEREMDQLQQDLDKEFGND